MAVIAPPHYESKKHAKLLASHEQRLKAVEDGLRNPQLGNSSIDNGALTFNDDNGNARVIIAADGGGYWGILDTNNPNPPPVPSAPTVVAGFNTLIVSADGTTADGAGFPSDLSHINVYVAPPSGEFALAGNMPASRGKNFPVSVPIGPLENQQYRVTITAVNFTGRESAKSAETLATPNLVVGQDILTGIIDATKLAAEAVTEASLAAGAVTKTKVADDAIDTPQLTAGAVRADKIAAGQIQASHLITGAVTAEKIAALAITTDKLAANSVETGKIAAGAITASKLDVNMVMAGRIITGDPTGARVEMHPIDGLQGFKDDGTRTFWIDAATGNVLVVGEYATAASGSRIRLNPNGTNPDAIWIYPSGGGDFAQITSQTAPSDGSAAILIDGGAGSSSGRGRLGAYAAEGFVAYSSSFSGYSRSAVSCNNFGINMWAQTEMNFTKYNNSSIIGVSEIVMRWVVGTSGPNTPIIVGDGVGAGVKFDASTVGIVNAAGDAFRSVNATSFNVVSSAEVKEEITDIRQFFEPLAVIEQARARKYKYRDEVIEWGEEAPTRFGPIAEELPESAIRMNPAADGSGFIPGVSLNDQIGILWGAVNQLLDRRITSTTTNAFVPAGQNIPAGGTKEVDVTWDSEPLAVPTDALVLVDAGILGFKRVTAWLKPGSVTADGCTVVFKNISSSAINVVNRLNGLTNVSATVVGQALYTPPLAA